MLDKQRGYWHSAELLTAAKMAEAGMVVSVPLIPVRYDLIGDYAGKLIRVQVKRAKWREQRLKPTGKGDRACWSVTLTRHSAGTEHKHLLPTEFDYVSIMCTPQDIYFVPVSALLGPDGTLIKGLQIKPPDLTNTRADATTSGERYEPYRNRFVLGEPPNTLQDVSLACSRLMRKVEHA